MPGLPERSVTAPRQLMMSERMDCRLASGEESGEMMPSPLKRVLAKMRVVSAVSAAEMVEVSGLPRLTRICLAEARRVLPSAVASLMAESGSVGEDLRRSSGFLRRLVVQVAAARSSGGRM